MEIRMKGYVCQLCRWQVTYQSLGQEVTEYVPTEAEADALVQLYGGTKTALDTAADEWADGITVPETSIRPKTDAEAIIAQGKEAYFERIRTQKQDANKAALAEWLSAHPLLWTDGNPYGVAEEDQKEMALNLMQYQLAVQAGQSKVLEWHTQKKSCRVFELEEFTALSLSIVDYVYPYLRYQESVKEKIYAAQTIEEINNVEINYASV